jgi:hypothetical protein
MSQEVNRPETRSRTCSTGSNSSNVSSHSVKRQREAAELNESVTQATKSRKIKNSGKMAKVTLDSLNVKLDSLLATADTNQEKIDKIPDILTFIGKVASDVKALETRTSTLESQVTEIYEQLYKVGGACTKMSTELNQVQQANLQNSFTIRGLPGNLPKDQALTITTTLGTVIGLTLNSTDFSTKPFVVFHRDKKESHIIGAFHDLRVKNQMFQKYKENQPITVEDLCNGLDPQSPLRGKKVLLKNLLTRDNRQLLYDARQHTDLFLYVWESNGRILARRAADTPPIAIQSLQHLHEIVNRLRSAPAMMNVSNSSTRS